MRFVIVIGHLLLLQTTAIGQCESAWVETIGGIPTGSQASVGFALEVDESGFVYVVSSEYRSDSLLIGSDWIPGAGSTNVQNRDFYVTKYSPSGLVLWTVYASGGNQDYPKDAALDADGNVYVTGQFRDTLEFNGEDQIISVGSQDMFLCKISLDGALQWVRTYGNSVARGVALDVDDNGVYMAGVFFTDSIVVGDSIYHGAPPSGQSDIVVMSHNLNGNLIWSRHITGVNSQQVGTLSVNNGEIVLAGVYLEELVTTEETLLGNSTYNYYLLSMSSIDGGIVWARKSDGGGLSAIVEYIAFDNQSNIYLSGRFNTSSISFQNVQTTNSGEYDYFILKTTPGGDSEWIISSNGTGFEVISGMEVVDNIIVVTGGFTQSSFSIGDTVLANSGDTDIFLAQYNTENGEGICGVAFHGDGVEQGLGLSVVSEDIFVLGLFTDDIVLDGIPASPIGNQDVFVWKTCNFCDTLTSITETTQTQHASLSIYPNPFTTQTQLNYRTAQGTRPTLQLRDMLGRAVQTIQLPSHEGTYTLDAATLSTGIYFCSLVSGAEVLATQKLSVIKNE